MSSVTVNPPKTPVTKGSTGIAMATLPNMCKMPGPPAPFVPTPLPNIGDSGSAPEGYSTTVKIEGQAVAIAGASFGSSGDVASKGTGGGLTSANTEGPTKFLGPGSLDVKIEGKNVQLLGDQMLNNCGPGGSPSNSATMSGVTQAALVAAKKALQDAVCECDSEVQATAKDNCRSLGDRKHACVDKKIAQHNADKKQPKLGGEKGYSRKTGKAVPGQRMQLIGEPFAPDYVKRIAGKIFPDAAVLDDYGRPVQLAEFKFQCPAGTPTRKGAAPSTGTAPQDWAPGKNGKPGQLEKTLDLMGKMDPEVTEEPLLLTNESCT